MLSYKTKALLIWLPLSEFANMLQLFVIALEVLTYIQSSFIHDENIKANKFGDVYLMKKIQTLRMIKKLQGKDQRVTTQIVSLFSDLHKSFRRPASLLCIHTDQAFHPTV